MTLRSIERRDADALRRLWNTAARFDRLSPALLHEKLWGDKDFDPNLALVFEIEGALQAMAVGVCREQVGALANPSPRTPLQERGPGRGVQRGTKTAYVKLIAVDPPMQEEGLGSQLLAQIESRCRALGATEIRAGESAPNYLTPGVDLRYDAANHFFSVRGYEAFGEATNQEVDLLVWRATDRSNSSPANIDVRRAERNDSPAIRKLIDAHWPTWWDEVAQALANEPTTLHIAWEEDNAVGFAAYDANNQGTGWFGPMGTAPEHRGKGVGARLLADCLDEMAMKYAKAIIPWVGPIEFYERQAGAKIARTFQRYRKSIESH